MSKADDPKISSTGGVTPGLENASAPGPVKENGQHSSYWILSEEERSKGFVRPYRDTYVHVGSGGPKNPTRPLTDKEQEAHSHMNYVVFEEYPESEFPKTGKFWTQEQLDRANGCGSVTKMSSSIAETYARDPKFYDATFCVRCGNHLPVSEFVWDGTDERVGS